MPRPNGRGILRRIFPRPSKGRKSRDLPTQCRFDPPIKAIKPFRVWNLGHLWNRTHLLFSIIVPWIIAYLLE